MTRKDPASQPGSSTPSGEPRHARRDNMAVVLERAQARWRLWLAIAFLLLGLLLAWQGWVLRQNHTSARAVQASAEEAVPRVQQALKATLGKVSTALADPALVRQASAGTDAGRRQAAERLGQLLPGAAHVVIYSTGPEALLQQGKGALGFLRGAQLAHAQGSGERQVNGTRVDDGGVRLSIVQPVRTGEDIVAFAAVTMPLDALEYMFRTDVDAAGGRIDLRTGPGEDAMVLASRGDTDRPGVDVARVIPGTELWISGTRSTPDGVLPRDLPAVSVWIIALLLLAAAAALQFGERLAALGIVTNRKLGGDQGGGDTLVEVLQKEHIMASQANTEEASEAATQSPAAGAAADGVPVDGNIFRAYDIRGVVGQSLSEDVARALGRAIGSEARDREQAEIVVGRDGRKSGPMLSSALIEGIRSTGVDVIDIGQAPTPVVYFACFELDTGSGVAVTGSHNPPDYNGFKIVLGGETLAMEAIESLHQRILDGRFHEGEGALRNVNVDDDYVERIAGDVQAQRPLNVIVDCGNGVTGDLGPRVLEEIGCDVTPLYAEIDGDFPHHHPDPSNPDNLTDLILAVKHHEADLGIAFDGDGDRLGVVTRVGEVIYPDRLLMLFAQDVLVRDPGATIIYDVKCTGRLQPLILRHGGSPLMWKTGHSLIKAKMRETGAALAGELSGHFFFRERWYGFDDGIYAAARLLEILAGDLEERSPEAIFATLPKGVATPELNIKTEEGENHAFVDRFCRQAKFDKARITTIDGLRADWPDGWGLVRASNTTPSLVLRFNADSQAALERIQQAFRQQLQGVDPELELPF